MLVFKEENSAVVNLMHLETMGKCEIDPTSFYSTALPLVFPLAPVIVTAVSQIDGVILSVHTTPIMDISNSRLRRRWK